MSTSLLACSPSGPSHPIAHSRFFMVHSSILWLLGGSHVLFLVPIIHSFASFCVLRCVAFCSDGAADRGHLEVMRWLCDAGGRRPCACRTRSSASGPPRRAAVSMSVPAKAVDSPELRQFLLDAWQFGTRSRRISSSLASRCGISTRRPSDSLGGVASPRVSRV